MPRMEKWPAAEAEVQAMMAKRITVKNFFITIVDAIGLFFWHKEDD